jgi:uncharacterized protein (TIGR03000 family)
MFRKAFSIGGLLLLAGATVLVTPGSGQAQHRGGGGHGGGFHGGGFHGGGFRGSGFHHGGFHHGGFHHGGRGWYPGYYGYYGGSPYYYGSYPYGGYSNYYPSTYSPDWSSPAYNSGYYGSYGGVTPPYPASYSPATVQPDAIAQITVSLPADAVIWFDGSKTTSTGSVREYQSPPLTPGIRYTYEVRARWNENGQEVTQTQQVQITAGTRVNVHFPVQSTNAPTARRHQRVNVTIMR